MRPSKHVVPEVQAGRTPVARVAMWTLCVALTMGSIGQLVVAPVVGVGGAETWTYDLLGNIGGAGGAFFETSAINDSGVIVGFGDDPRTGRRVAWRFVDGGFGQSAAMVHDAAAYAINSRGDIFGRWSSGKEDWSSALIWQFNEFGAVMSSYPRLLTASQADLDAKLPPCTGVGYLSPA